LASKNTGVLQKKKCLKSIFGSCPPLAVWQGNVHPAYIPNYHYQELHSAAVALLLAAKKQAKVLTSQIICKTKVVTSYVYNLNNCYL
jgi:hypothetical protein